MVDYDLLGNMEGHLGNVTSTQWWKSSRWIVIRIEALAVVAIIFSFFLAAFGSCRRWSNSWIVQKGFFVAQVLSLSLGTYSIGLMQSSSVKSEMYPIWTVSLFTIFGCIDPVTTYNGLDYKGPLSKVVFGICLNFGYVLLMSISTISNVGNAAIITLAAITFVKGFHRSFALVQQNRMRDMMNTIHGSDAPIFRDTVLHCMAADVDSGIILSHIKESRRYYEDEWLWSSSDLCIALFLSDKLHSYFLGLDYHEWQPQTLKFTDLKWVLKVIEIELAFVYDALYTGNPFFHYYQAKTASLWALASFAGICFVLVATAIPGIMTWRQFGTSGCTKVVGTTTADLAITFVILVSLALLQLMQLFQSWTSNWARVAIAYAYGRRKDKEFKRAMEGYSRKTCKLSGWMRLKVLVATSTNLFDKYLWQDKISQYSMLPEPRLLAGGETKGQGISSSKTKGGRMRLRCVYLVQMLGLHYIRKVIWELFSSNTNKGGGVKYNKDVKASIPERISPSEIESEGTWSLETTKGEWIRRRYGHLVQTLGLHYIWQVIWELLSSDSNKRGGVKLDEDVKGSVIGFLGQIQSDRLDRNWLSSLPEEPQIRYFLPHFKDPQLHAKPEALCYRYTSCVLTWHVATWYCEVAEHKRQEDALMSKQAEIGREIAARYCLRKAAAKTRDHRRVANALSMYCVYLVKSAPELLPGPVARTKRVYDRFVLGGMGTRIESSDKDTILGNMSDDIIFTSWYWYNDRDLADISVNGGALAKLLMRRSDTWETLARVWVQLLVYAAPYGKPEAHMRHLSQGGEFITHLWALLYHFDIHEWKVLEANPFFDIANEEDAQRILNDDDPDLDVVVFFTTWKVYRGGFLTASRLIDGVKFYETSSRDVAKFLNFPAASILVGMGILFLNNTDKKFTFFDSQVYDSRSAKNFAVFVYETKLASAKERAQESAPSTSHNPIPSEKQNLEEGHTVVEIEEEIMPPPPPSS